MPYVKKEVRDELMPVTGRVAYDAGELNYQITNLLLDYIEVHGTSYQTINDVLGATEGAKQEFYRRVAVPYETHKIDVNGDVY